MPKSCSVDLSELIHSLQTGEIVYFKKYAKRHCEKEAIYLQLFEHIKLMEDYNEVKLMQLSNITNKKRFAEQKCYLYNLVLESLTAYHRNKKIDFEVRDMMSKAIILMNKKLFQQSLKMVHKAKELAVTHNLTYAINEILAIESMVSLETFVEDDFVNHYKNAFDEYETNAKKILHIGVLLKIRCLANGLYFKYGTMAHLFDATSLAYCATEMNKVDRSKIMILEQLIYDSNTLDLLSFSKEGDLYQSISERLIIIYESNTTLIQQHTQNYINVLAQGASQNLIHHNNLAYTKNITALKMLLPLNPLFGEQFFKVMINSKIQYLSLIHFLKQGNVKQAYSNIQASLLSQLVKKTQLHNFYLVGLVCFYNEKYEEALDWFNAVFDQSNIRLDFQLLSRMYEIACHVELKNYILVNHKLISLNRYYKKLNIPLQQISCFIKFIKLHLDLTDCYKNRKLSNHYESQLIELCKKEALDKYNFEIALYAVMKNNKLNFSDALDYYNCNVTTSQPTVIPQFI
jgi:hypothetical protein